MKKNKAKSSEDNLHLLRNENLAMLILGLLVAQFKMIKKFLSLRESKFVREEGVMGICKKKKIRGPSKARVLLEYFHSEGTGGGIVGHMNYRNNIIINSHNDCQGKENMKEGKGCRNQAGVESVNRRRSRPRTINIRFSIQYTRFMQNAKRVFVCKQKTKIKRKTRQSMGKCFQMAGTDDSVIVHVVMGRNAGVLVMAHASWRKNDTTGAVMSHVRR